MRQYSDVPSPRQVEAAREPCAASSFAAMSLSPRPCDARVSKSSILVVLRPNALVITKRSSLIGKMTVAM